MMAENYTKELNQKNVREKLNSEKIKLWLPPYTTESDEKGDIPKVCSCNNNTTTSSRTIALRSL